MVRRVIAVLTVMAAHFQAGDALACGRGTQEVDGLCVIENAQVRTCCLFLICKTLFPLTLHTRKSVVRRHGFGLSGLYLTCAFLQSLGSSNKYRRPFFPGARGMYATQQWHPFFFPICRDTNILGILVFLRLWYTLTFSLCSMFATPFSPRHAPRQGNTYVGIAWVRCCF